MTEKEVDVNSLPLEINCQKCGKEITLWFNGGELDDGRCCGYRYALEHRKVVFVTEEINKQLKEE